MRTTAAPFVGRERELARVRAALEAAASGSPRFVLVSGEAGIGKSRLAEEAAAATDLVVLRGACYPDDWRPPLDPWSRVVEQLLDELGPDAFAARAGRALDAIADAVPAVAAAFPAGGLPSLPAAESRYRTYEAFRLLLGGEGTPLLAVLDDIHWADAGSRELLAYLARSAQGSIAVLATFRGGEVDAELLAELLRHAPVEQLALGPLGNEDAERLVERLHELPAEPARIAEIARRTDGNPFFISQVVQHVAEGGDLDAVPATVRLTIAARRNRLSPTASQVLGVAVAFRGPFAFDLLSALGGLDEERTLDAIDELLRARLIRTTADERYEFEHALIREALYEELNPSRRARLHRRIAESIESVFAEAAMDHAAELAVQYDASSALPGSQRGVAYAIAAADEAAARHAYAQEAEFLRIAKRLGGAAPLERRVDVVRRLAEAEAKAFRIDDAVASVREALALLEETGNGETEAVFLQRMSWALHDAGGPEDVVADLVERGLALLEGKRDLTWARLKVVERRYERIDAGPVQAGRWLGYDPEALAVIREHGDEADQAASLATADLQTREEVEEVVRRVEGWQDTAARMHGLSVIAMAYLFQLGDLPAAERFARQLHLEALEGGSVVGQAHALLWIAEAHYVRGEFEEGRQAQGRARELISRLGPSHVLRRTMGGTSTADYLVDGDWRRVAELQRSLALDPRNPPSMSLSQAARSAYGYVRLGERERALEQLGWIVQASIESPTWQLNRNLAVAWAGQLAWELEDAELAAALRDALDPLAASGVLLHAQVTSAEIAHACCAAVLGDHEAADRGFAAARAGTEARGEQPLRALVDYYDAVSRLRAGRPGGHELLTRAHAAFAALGMTVWIARASELLASRELPDGLTAREAEVLARLAAGQANKEIASALVLSVRTVERHIANAYRKIDAHNRAEATAYALRHGLTT